MSKLVEDEETGELWLESGFANTWRDVLVWDDEIYEAHVVPEGDIGAHVMAEDCPCCPQMDHEGVWQHRAYDDREAYEEKRRRPH